MRMTENEDFEQPDGECQHSSAEYADDSSFELTDDLILPKHPSLIEGHLENGLKYLVVPNNFPRGRFEAHLEILSGSINEMESQQGMAHLLEHIAYMGSPKRQLISGTGSRTNGYTDFHHTVFYAACPTISPDAYRKRPMLPMALDALLDVLQTVVDDERLEKERAAVLSEASMVNTMDYRVECQLLSALHRENRIGRRFPIGKEAQIRAWTREEVQRYHATHYRPDNAVLYLVGDLGDQSAAVLGLIRDKFGPLAPLPAAERQALEASGEFPRPSMKEVHRHYPPVAHRWSLSPARAAQLLPAHLAILADPPEPDPSCPIKPTRASFVDPVSPAATLGSSGSPSSGEELTTALTAASRLFKHELVQAVSFHLFAKRPIEPLTSAGALRRELARRLVLTALTVRLNVLQRQAPLFTLADVACLAWVREGCTVCSLDLTTDLPRWRQAVQLAVREVRRMGRYGLTASELLRYKQSLLSEIGQLLAQAEQQPHEEVLNELMEAEAVGHTFMEPRDRFGLVSALLQDLGREEVAQVGRELCEHLSHCDPTAGVVPAAIVASCPVLDRDGQPTSAVSEAELVAAVREVLEEAVEPPQETAVPERILADEEVQRKVDALRPHWLEPNPNPSKPTVSREDLAQRTLSNGLRVNLKSLVEESQEVRVRLFVPGGRLLEDPARPGAMLLAARTMQEGGAFSLLSREEVELFCIDHAIAVEIKAVEDALLVDLHALTVPGAGKVVSGVEGALQVAHVLLTDFLFEQDAFLRAQQALHEQSDSAAKGLEAVCREQLLSTLTAGDDRLLTPSHGQLDAIGLDEVRSLIHGLLRPENVEISISGDLPLPALEALALRYLGTVPPSPNPSNPNPSLRLIQESLRVRALGREQQLRVHLTDSDERAMGYVAGPAPNRFGLLADGRSLSELLAQAPGLGPHDQERRRHPLFGYAVLQLIQEVTLARLTLTLVTLLPSFSL